MRLHESGRSRGYCCLSSIFGESSQHMAVKPITLNKLITITTIECVLRAKLRNRTCQGLDRQGQGQGQGQGPSLQGPGQGQGLDLQGQGQGQGQGLKFGP